MLCFGKDHSNTCLNTYIWEREISVSGLDLLPFPWRYRLHIHSTSAETWQNGRCGLFTAARVHMYWIMLSSYFMLETGSSRVVECLSENTRPIQQDAQTTAAVLRVSASIIITYLKLKFCFTWDTVWPDDFSWSFGCSALLGCGFCKEKKIPVTQEHPLNLGSRISPRGRDAFEFA